MSFFIKICKFFTFSFLIITLSSEVYALSSPSRLTPVSVQLNWKHQFEFAAFYAAIEQGYYRDAGLDVTLHEGGVGIDMVAEVLSGRAQFGVSNSSLLLERSSGKPVVAIGALMQHSAIALLASRERGINTVEDLNGKIIQCPVHACNEIKAYLKASGVKINGVSFTPFASTDAVERLKVADATEVYSTNDGFRLLGERHRYVLLLPRSAGVDLYGNVLFTSEQVLNSKPDLVKRFREATFKGLSYAMSHHEELTALIVEKFNSQNKSLAHLNFEADRLTDLIRTDLVESGYMNKGRWNHARDVYADLGLVSRDYELSNFIYDPHPSQSYVDKLNRRLLISFCIIVILGVVGAYVTYLSRELTKANVSLAEANSKLDMIAHFDDLTKVPNRTLFYDRLQQSLALAKRNNTRISLMVIDLDKFKLINDTYGHAIGDLVLQVSASRMQEAIRQTDTVGRIGGDEFVILLPEVDSIESALDVTSKIRDAFTEPISIGDLTIPVSLSIGVAVFPDHGANQIELFRNADDAMYFAKSHQGNNIHLCEQKSA